MGSQRRVFRFLSEPARNAQQGFGVCCYGTNDRKRVRSGVSAARSGNRQPQAEGEKIPRKGSPGITRSDLLVINEIDGAPLVGANLSGDVTGLVMGCAMIVQETGIAVRNLAANRRYRQGIDGE
jgi:hypothetical protein